VPGLVAKTALGPVGGLCACCGRQASEQVDGPAVCQTCRDMDKFVSGSFAPRAPLVRPVKRRNFTLPMDPDADRTCPRGPGWKMIQIPPDGDCLFDSLVVGKLCVLRTTPVPRFEIRGQWGSQARSAFLKHLVALRDRGSLVDGVSLEQWVSAATDLTLPTYLEFMRKARPNDVRTWGGFLESSLICSSWRCWIANFVWKDGRPELWRVAGGDNTNPAYRHHGRICVLFWGNALRLAGAFR